MQPMHVMKLCKSQGKKNVGGAVFRKHTKPKIASILENLKFSVFDRIVGKVFLQ